ncbi:MAG TPA: hypothetical protein VIL26_00890 [Clostridia bacterium]
MRFFNRFFILIISFILCFSFLACNSPSPANNDLDDDMEEKPLTSEYGIADQNYLFGMCYLMEEREYDFAYDMEKEVKLMKNLGVKSVRQWMHFSTLMYDKNTLKKDACEKMHTLLKLCSDSGMVNIGMNHHNFNNGTNSIGKPKRLIYNGSSYVNWLNDYYTSWYTLVSEFPEIKYWEVDNEVNNKDFMKNEYGQAVYSVQEMADIAADMFYYASRAIHDANPDAIVVMGSMTEPEGLGNGNLLEFFEVLYNNIESGNFGYFYGKEDKQNASTNADDYFQIACWHPYVWTDFKPDEFVEKNAKIYDILLKHEGKHKKVFLTELGFNDKNRGEENTALAIRQLYTVIKEKMPYVESVHYFKMFDTALTDAWDSHGDYVRFGLFYDPDVNRKYPLLNESHKTPTEGGTLAVNGKAKIKAYTYQELAGGSGNLDLLVKK